MAEAILLQGCDKLVGFVDDGVDTPLSIWGYPVLGSIASLHTRHEIADAAVVAIGNNATRKNLHALIRDAGFTLVTVIHPTAFVSPSASLGAGCAVMAGAIVGTEAILGEGVIVNCGATVDHHCRVHSFGHLGVNACMAGGSGLGQGTWMQAGSALGYGVEVADGAVLVPGEARNS